MRNDSRKLNMRSKARKRSSNWKRVVSALGVIVVFCTVYALVLPAITLSEDPVCGQQAHEHTDACYRYELLVMNCAAADHVHDGSCADALGNPACGFGEKILHTHGASCYDAQGELICTLPELQEHIHDEACTGTEMKLICTLEESEGHTHSAECTAEAQLSCTLEETEGHAHGDSCYQVSEEPSCGQDHEHVADCYVRELICTLEEAEGHTHGDGCYTEAKTCELEETEGHTHGEACYEAVVTNSCDIEQVANHLHTESCFNEAGERTCGLISGVVHVHDETCFSVIRLDAPEQICKLPEHIHVDACYLDPADLPPVQKEFYCDLGAHSHGDACYDGSGALICTIPVHSHQVSCRVPDYDPEADIETAEDWEATLKEVTLTGKWPKDLLAVAASQLDYRESKQNVVLLEDGSVMGYTRYGAWYEAPYIDWSAAFVSFCTHYAGVDALPKDSSCESYLSRLEELGLLRTPMDYLPKPGDIVVLNTDGDEETKADHLGIVSELLKNDAGELTVVKVLVGDANDQVRYLTYDILSGMILGYGETPAGESRTLLCEKDHDHTGSCYGYKLYYTDDTLQAQVLIEGIEDLPAGVTLQVDRVTAASDPAGYSGMIAALSQRLENSPYYMGDASFYQMALLLNGENYDLPGTARTSVDVSFADPVFTEEAMKNAAKVETYLMTELESAEENSQLQLGGTLSSNMSVALGGTEGTGSGEVFQDESRDTYQADRVEEDTYENASGGLTGIGFESNMISTFAAVLTNTTKEGQFWERVFSADEIVSGGTYMIVSAEGNYALRGNNSSNNTAVTIHAQKGEEYPDADWEANPERNTRYYTITTKGGGAVDNNLYWTITKSGSNYTIRNQATSNYLYMSSFTLIGSSTRNLKLSYVTPENVWRIYYDTTRDRYLNNEGTGDFSSTTGSDGNYGSTIYYYTRDMLIFKLSDVTSLTIPPDVVDSTEGEGSGTGVAPEKPDYGAFIDPTDKLQGETAVEKDGVKVNGQYFSDPSTSDIETQFRQDTYAQSETIDGKVVTDKSVIYGGDDYGAFNGYPGNTFSVTLSTLGQEYEIPYQYMIKTPVDVVFVLDVSGSMSSVGDGSDNQRVVDLCTAANAAIGQIMNDHVANRVGIAIYSSGAWELLPLDRYTADNGEYLVTYDKPYSHDPSGLNLDIKFLQGSSSLKNDDGVSFANVGSDVNQGVGTYTQAGIAMGNEIFEAIGDDTTYTTTLGVGESEREFTVKRQPVFILLSDGEPTHSTPHYNDVLKGPHYGNGLSSDSNGKGIHGYYTVLSANYYKRAVGIQYETPALFYTIGMRIHETEDGPLADSYTGDNYKRAVLNPEKDIIENLTAETAEAITVDQLKAMLQNTYTDQTVEVNPDFPEAWYGVPHAQEPVLQPNPYTDDYSYADDAFFGVMAAKELEEVFNEIYQSSLKLSPYGFVLYRNSSVNILDNIGEGMEIKGTPVLRYGGINYTDPEIIESGSSVSYIYEGTYSDPYIPGHEINLSEITVTITTNDDGTQTVFMYVPDTALPTYTPELIGQKFYYEQLPVRLIYQVGLTAESEAAVLELAKNGGELVYYTNQWKTDDVISTSTLLPSTANPFYYDADGDGTEPPYKAHHSLKTDNPTDTVDYHVDCHRDIETVAGEVLIEVLHKQGNNGKLVFKAENVDIPVEKQWGDGINAEIMNPVEMVVYKVTETVDENGATIRNADRISSVTLSNDNNWAATITGLQETDGTWYYVVAEAPVAGYTATYNMETVKVTTDGGDTYFNAVKVDGSGAKITATNTVAVQLPSTGGAGTQWYTLGGLLLMTAAAILWYSFCFKRRKEETTFP